MKDVIVVGGGPAGSTAANLLAQAGHSVLVIERETFPRFHIGESLLPCDLEVFRRLGVDPAGAGYLYKAGAEFIDERIGGHTKFLFAEALPGTPDHAFQVERSRFDHWLLQRAQEVGATVRQGLRVQRIEPAADGVTVHTDGEVFNARYVIDATGQDAIVGRGQKSTDQIVEFGLAATFSHFEQLDPAIDRELCETAQGNIKVLFVDDGWCWAIPLGGRKISIGLVSRRKGITSSWLGEVIAQSKFLSRVTQGAVQPRKPGLIASFSFHNRKQHGARWACTGDAACFLDPVFSSGVSLGMVGAAHLVDDLLPALRAGTEARPALMDSHAAHLGHAYNVFATLVHSFYHSGLLHGLFFAPEPDHVLRQGLTSVLAGDVWRSDNVFQDKLMKSKRRVVELPATRVGDESVEVVGH
ncbi:MAG: NAD(P)/FAD-dependent oxidoreductase [Kofleriaceae bacterium]|nr:NAD(P)/FAD-dependent oxidoreductase [Kofleriaceae bacterium]